MGVLTGAALSPLAWADEKPGRWLRLESSRFIYFSQSAEFKAREELIALERYHAMLTKLVPREQRSEPKLTIYAAANGNDLNRAAPGVGSGVAGFYNPKTEHIRAITAAFRAPERQSDVPKEMRAMDERVILFHEYSHHFMMTDLKTAYPAWYREGFAELTSTAVLTNAGIQVGKYTRNRAYSLAGGKWLPIEKFLDPSKLSSEDEIITFYAQSWLAAHYLFTHADRARGFNRYTAALANGDDPVAAFEPSVGVSMETFDKELREYKRKPTAYYTIAETPQDFSADIKVQRMTAAADELLMIMSNLLSAPSDDAAKAHVTRVRAEAAKFPSDLFAQRALAHVEVWYGDAEKARSLLTALAAVAPKDPEIIHLNGVNDLRQGYRTNDQALFKRARGQFAEAHRLDATRAQSLFRYVECLRQIEPDFTTHMADVASAAYQLAPQVPDIRMLAVQGLMQHKLWKEARDILFGMAASAHESEYKTEVMALMDAVKAQTALPIKFHGTANTMGQEI